MPLINIKRSYRIFLASILTLPLSTMAIAQSQPIVVLEYPNSSTNQQNFSDNLFVQNYDYTTTHKVQPDETLSHILDDYYAGSGLNMKFVEMAIIAYNKHAFVKNNPNFLPHDPTLPISHHLISSWPTTLSVGVRHKRVHGGPTIRAHGRSECLVARLNRCLVPPRYLFLLPETSWARHVPCSVRERGYERFVTLLYGCYLDLPSV